MLEKRKFIIWLSSLIVVLAVYLVYNQIVETPEIRLPQGRQTIIDVNMPGLDEGSAKIADTAIGTVQLSRFVELDEKTKQLRRVSGFERLENPPKGSEKWKLVKPYMDIYGDEFNVHITSDHGTAKIETIAGNPSPTDAQLIGNVVIKIKSPDSGGPSDTTINLDDLVYNSERSEFTTDGPVKLTSQNGRMQGNGMILIYNTQLDRIELLKIINMDSLYLTDIAMQPSSAEPEPAVAKQTSAGPSLPASTTPRQTQQTVVKQTPASPQSPQDDYYECLLNRDVEIKYGDSLIVSASDHITIDNILWAKQTTKQTQRPAGTAKPAKPAEFVESAKPVKTADSTGPAVSAEKSAVVPQSDDRPDDIKVTCSGGMVIRPMNSALTLQQDSKPQPRRTTKTIAAPAQIDYNSGQTSSPAGPQPARFNAKQINYNLTTQIALAERNIKLTLHATSARESKPIPVVITAAQNAQFFTGQDRMVFNGDVVGTSQTSEGDYLLQKNSLHSQKLIVDLDPTEQDISHVTAVGGKVKLLSTRFNRDVKINRVMLLCDRMDYNKTDEIIIATGPGKIEINNENAPPPPRKTDRQLALDGPCYGLIQGFDTLRWFTAANRLTADGRPKSLHLSYLPLVNGSTGQLVYASAGHVKADFAPTATGQNKLTTLTAEDGVTYKQIGGREFMGDRLIYDAQIPLITVTGSENVPVFLDGVMVDENGIEYNPQTDKAKLKLAPTPGAVTLPAKTD